VERDDEHEGGQPTAHIRLMEQFVTADDADPRLEGAHVQHGHVGAGEQHEVEVDGSTAGAGAHED